MKLSELLTICPTKIELHDGIDGKLVAVNRDTLQKYANVTVLSIYSRIQASTDHASSFLYVYGKHTDIEEVRERNKK